MKNHERDDLISKIYIRKVYKITYSPILVCVFMFCTYFIKREIFTYKCLEYELSIICPYKYNIEEGRDKDID